MDADLAWAARARRIYALALTYLVAVPGVTPDILARHITPTPGAQRLPTLGAVYRQLLDSAQNAGMGPAVIGGSVGGIERLAAVLRDFEPVAVVAAYGHDLERMLADIIERVGPRGQVRQGKGSLWPRFCRTATTGAAFLAALREPEDRKMAGCCASNDVRGCSLTQEGRA